MSTRAIRRTGILIALALLLLMPFGASAQAPVDTPGADLRVFLLTMGQGDLVWEKFGHNAIWVHDPWAGTDRVFNFGVFDFDAPGYWGRFIRGDWVYQLAVHGINETLAQYEYFDRAVVAQELDLSSTEKLELQRLLEINALPENRDYLYDYYRDNCSTRVRDVLDRVTGGALGAVTIGVPTGTTYRWHSERLIASDVLAYTGLAGGLGPRADREIDAWEEMFLPGKLMERMREVRLADGRPLVASERVLYAARGRAPERNEPPIRLPWYLLVGATVGAALYVLGVASATGGALSSRAARFGFAAIGSLWALLTGTGGLILAGLWAFTNHTIAHGNENLLQFSPIALPLVLLVPLVAYSVRWAVRPALWIAATVVLSSVAGFVLQLLPWLDQVNGEIIAMMLPAHLGLVAALYAVTNR